MDKKIKASLRSNLKPALISSFSVRGFDEAFAHWPDGVAIDLYAFMYTDSNADGDAAAFLNNIAKDKDGACEKAAKRILDACARHHRHEPIVAISSFLPPISCPRRDHDNYEIAINAAVGLIRLAKCIRAADQPELRTIELVSGTRIGGIWHGQWRGEKPHPSGKTETFFAFRDADLDNPIRRLTENLTVICDRAGLQPQDELALALELEPGPLYVLNDLATIERFITFVEGAGLKDLVGINLDCAHWQLAQIRTEVLEQRPDIMGHVVHAHISDHAKGHFGDVPIGDLGFELKPGTSIEERLDPFRAWLDLLAAAWFDKTKLTSRKGPRGSGYVSIEMEACRGMDAIQQSVRVLRGLLAE